MGGAEHTNDVVGAAVNGTFTITYDLGKHAKYNENNTITETYTYSETDTYTLNDGTELKLDKGYEFKGWYENLNFSGSPVTSIAAKEDGNKTYYAKVTPIPAIVPSVNISWYQTEDITITDGVNATITYGAYNSSKVHTTMNRTGEDRTTYDYTYTWYKNSTNSSSGGELISGATRSIYEVPTNLAASTTPYYYYCVLKATRKDNGEYATVATNTVKLTVNKATAVVNEAPTAKSDLEYTGVDQELLATGGKGNLANENDSAMEYACTQEEIAETETEKINALTYSTAIPTAVNAGTYYVWYRAAVSTAHANNYNASAAKCLTVTIDKATPSTPTGLAGAAPTTIADNDGKITGISPYTTGNSQVEYTKLASDTDEPTPSSTWTKCTGNEITGLSAGTYCVRYSADSNHKEGAYAKVTVPETPDRNITIKDNTAVVKVDDIEASKAKGGKSVTITANAKKGYDFSSWSVVYGDDIAVTVTPTVGAQQPTATFIMPAADVTVEALYTPAALAGTASLNGKTMAGETLTAALSDTNNTGTLTYKWYRNDIEISGATKETYTLVTDDIGKTITVKIGSTEQTGEVAGSTAEIIKRRPSYGYKVPTQKPESGNDIVTVSSIEEKLVKIELAVRSTKTAKKNIKLTIKASDNSDDIIKEIEKLGYTVKYKFYRSTKKASGYKAKLIKSSTTYINTSGKKGTMYYYKVRIIVYDKDGELVAQTELKQCKYANRLWTK